MLSRARSIAELYEIADQVIAIERLPGGHIHDSFVLRCQRGGEPVSFLLQRINTDVFPRPELVMENIEAVTSHISRRIAEQCVPDAARRVLTVLHTPDGRTFHRDNEGDCWRLYQFIDDSLSVTAVGAPEQAERAGAAFGEFQRMLADYDGPRLHETIPGFHDTPKRYEALSRVVQVDPHSRAAAARPEIDFAFARSCIADELLGLQRTGDIPERITHNDAKISNVLFDRRTGRALCVVDLDTVMPGLSLYDFGDMVRSMTTLAGEDEPDVSKVEFRPDFFEALARGYLRETHALLTPAESVRLVLSGKLITLEQGVRFLTDYLGGDTYYQTTRSGQNLDRCRTQFKLVEEIEHAEGAMNRIVKRLLAAGDAAPTAGGERL